MPKNLTILQQRFLDNYLRHHNATRASIEAGYSWRSARKSGAANLARPIIREKIATAQRKKRLEVEAAFDARVRELLELINADMSDLYDDNGALLDREQWPKIWRDQLVKSFSKQTVVDAQGSESLRFSIEFLDRTEIKRQLGTLLGAYKRLPSISAPPDDTPAS